MSDLNQGWRNKDAYGDSQGVGEDRASQIYSDLDLFFSKNNTDKDINIINNIQAVKRSVRNLVLMNQYEKPFL